MLDDIYKGCKICKQHARTPPRPVVTLPMASQFNEIVSMDLKKWKGHLILHMIDMWSRMTLSVFIKNKSPEEFIDKICESWIGSAGFGVMR